MVRHKVRFVVCQNILLGKNSDMQNLLVQTDVGGSWKYLMNVGHRNKFLIMVFTNKVLG